MYYYVPFLEIFQRTDLVNESIVVIENAFHCLTLDKNSVQTACFVKKCNCFMSLYKISFHSCSKTYQTGLALITFNALKKLIHHK